MRLPFPQAATGLLPPDAVISGCGGYRYTLERHWGPGPILCWVMHNPSTADALHDDPTIIRCVRFAKAAGYGGLVVVNLFAYRSTDPEALANVVGAVGHHNDRHIHDQALRCGDVVCAWGSSGGKRARERAAEVEALLRSLDGVTVHALRLSKAGVPWHPLYLPKRLRPVPWRPGDTQADLEARCG